MEIAQANVQSYCGDAAGIESICKWGRELKVKSTFDEKAFKEDNAELHAEFSHEEVGGVAHIVIPKQGYAQ